ncbi:MAG: peptidylprolyl isomerase [Ilumatobacteraceae bacterium]
MNHRRLRRLASLPVAALAAVLVSSCSTVSPSKGAFSVNDVNYPADVFAGLMEDLASGGQFQLTNGKINAADYIPIIRTLVRYEAYNQMKDEFGLEETETVRAKVTSDAQASEGWANYPDSVKKIVINLGVADTVLATAKVPSQADLKSLYEASPASTGVLCMSHILVDTEKEAHDVLARLDAGEKFADVAREVSTEPIAKDSGGSLGPSADQPCQTLGSVQEGYDPSFVDGAVAAKAGMPTAPVKSSFGWHVILVHPFDEVATAVGQVLSEGTGNSLLAGWMTTADISVDARYGTWKPARATVE